MKKTIFCLFAFAANTLLNAQSFEKGYRIIDVNLGLAVYNTSVTDNQATSAKAVEGKAGATILAPAFEWAVGRRISLGGSLVYSNYLSSADSTTGTKPTASGLDGVFLFNYHIITKKKLDLFAGLRLGIAGIRMLPNDGTENIYGSMGRSSDLHLGARIYVSDRVGIIAELGFPQYKFSKFGNSLEYTYTVLFQGTYIGTGIAFKLGGSGASAGGTDK